MPEEIRKTESLSRHGQILVWLRCIWCRYRAELAILLLFLIISLLMTYPVAWNLSSAMAGVGGDAAEHLWSLWWGKKAMLDLRTSMANLSYLYHPTGAYHPLLSATPMVQIVELPLALLFKPVVAYNLTFLSGYVLTAYTTYLLCYHVARDRRAAFVGGLIFGFAPTRSIHGFGHLAQTITYWFPLYALFAVKLMRRPSWKMGFATGILLGISALVNSVHTAYFVFVFTLSWLVYFGATQRHRFFSPGFIRSVGLMFLVGAGLSLPFLLPLILAQSLGTAEYETASGVVAFSANPFSFFLPSPHHPLVKWLGGSSTITDLLEDSPVENLAYVGLLPFALALWGALKSRPAARLWVFFAIVTVVLSLGPLLKIGGDPVVLDVVDGRKVFVPLPYLFLRILPLFGMGRNPARIAVGTPMALAVLVSLGMVQLRKWLRRRWPHAVLPVAAFVTAVILFEYCVVFPYPTVKLPFPGFYEQVREEQGNFAILDYPLNLYRPEVFHEFRRPMFYQTIHEHPIAGGKVWRLPLEGKATLLWLNSLVAPENDIRPEIFDIERTARERVGWLSAMNFRYLVLHKQDPGDFWWKPRTPEVIKKRRDFFESWLSAPVYEDEHIIAFRVPTAGAVSGAPLTAVVRGWYPSEGQTPRQWMGQEGQVDAYLLTAAPYRLAFTAEAFKHPRQISLAVNGKPVFTTTVHAARRFVTPLFTLEPGLNEIVFKAVEACSRPADVDPKKRDQRCLSVAFSRMEWSQKGTEYGDQHRQVLFGDHFRLLGYDLDQTQARPGGQVDLVLYWEVLERSDRDYTVFTHIIGPGGQRGGQKDNPPVNGRYPTTWLGSGEIVQDEYTIPIWDDTRPGRYSIQVGWYDLPTGERLSVTERNAVDLGMRLVLTEIDIVEREE